MNKLILLVTCFLMIISLNVQAEVKLAGQYQIINTEKAADGPYILSIKLELENLGDTDLQNLELELMDPMFSLMISKSDVLTTESFPANTKTFLTWTIRVAMPLDHLPENMTFLVFGTGTEENNTKIPIFFVARKRIVQ
ncbi:MAG: hypothetical protein ACU88J_08630 [Gammaproteobacteria bacterium]